MIAAAFNGVMGLLIVGLLVISSATVVSGVVLIGALWGIDKGIELVQLWKERHRA